jgi:hypothetical protein
METLDRIVDLTGSSEDVVIHKDPLILRLFHRGVSFAWRVLGIQSLPCVAMSFAWSALPWLSSLLGSVQCAGDIFMDPSHSIASFSDNRKANVGFIA